MKILYDHQIFSTQKYGGISRYFFQLIRNLNKVDRIDYKISIKFAKNVYILNDPQFCVKRDTITDDFFFGLQFRGKARLFDILGRMSIVDSPHIKNLSNTMGLLKDSDFDVFHPTSFGDYFLDHLRNKPFVLTVYDMIHEIYADRPFEKSYKRLIETKHQLIRRASHVIAISNNTKRDIIRMYGIDEDKITVTYLANSLDPDNTEEMGLSVPDNYILFVGDRHAYKNFDFFLTSIEPLLSKNRDLFVVCAGSIDFTPKERSLFAQHKLTQQIIHIPFANDGTLINLYRNANCFVYPTLYEGFGIPVLEAFACDCPAVISNTSSLPEVAGDAGIYFDPTDADSILEAIKKAIYDTQFVKKMKRKAIDQLNRFSWEKCARETIAVYKNVI